MAIRTFPSDFQVTEQLTEQTRALLAAAASAPVDASVHAKPAPGVPRPARPVTYHQWWRLDKVSLSTPEAIDRFAKAARIPPSSISYVGLKDKHAQTSQYISTPIAFKDLLAPPPAAIMNMPRSGPASAAQVHEPDERDESHGRDETDEAPDIDESDDTPAPQSTAPLTRPAASWSATPLARLTASLAAHHVMGNSFSITVRRLSHSDLKHIAHRLEQLTITPGTALFTNYFGAQRFGSARHGEGFAAPLLVKGDYLAGLKLLLASPARKDSGPWRSFTRIAAEHWPRDHKAPSGSLTQQFKLLASKLPNLPEKRAVSALAQGQSPRDAFGELPAFLQTMCVEAYQSWLWNEAARRTIHAAAAQTSQLMIADHDEFTPMAFLPARALPSELISLAAPLPSPALTAAQPSVESPFLAHLSETLHAQGHTAGDLKLPGLRRPAFIENTRPLICPATDLSCTLHRDPSATASDATAKPHHAELKFTLPRGSYATVLLRALGQ